MCGMTLGTSHISLCEAGFSVVVRTYSNTYLSCANKVAEMKQGEDSGFRL